MRIYNAAVCTMDGGEQFHGWAEIADGKIKAVGAGEISVQAGDIDAQGGTLLPGFLDIHTHLGIVEDGIDFEGDDCNETTDPFLPHLRAIDAVNPFDDCFADARNRGITTVLTSPGSANACGGSILAMKTAGSLVDDMAVCTAGMKFALGENPKAVYDHRDETPVTRMATAALIREGLRKAQRYREDIEAAKADSDLSAPELDMKSEALLPVLSGEQISFFHCHRADDMATAMRIAREFSLRLVLIHGTEGWKIADTLAKQQIPVIVGPLMCNRCKPEMRDMVIENAAKLRAAGVKTAICTDHPEVPIQYLGASAIVAENGGLSHADALLAVTADAADIAGIGNRVGRIRAGLDADLQLYAPNVNPLALDAKPLWVMIDGRMI